MDRTLFSIIIFMKLMEEEGFLPEEEQKEISKDFKNWEFVKREALIIWWNTPLETAIKRLQKRGRAGESDIKYYEKLHQVYANQMVKEYKNVKVITRETQLTQTEVEEFIPEIINEKEIRP